MSALTTAATFDASEQLNSNPLRNELVQFLKDFKGSCGVLTREQVLLILGQWFHPLHYFPTFLSGLIAVTPDIETKTFISRILWQELGEGDPQRAHEKIYLETVSDNGFERQRVAQAPPSAATAELVAGYERAAKEPLPGLGFLYGTEVVDLPMVAAIGELMRRCTGKQHLPWVSIHVSQEPHHVESSNEALRPILTEEERQQVVGSAEEMWRLWLGFFRSIKAELFPQAN